MLASLSATNPAGLQIDLLSSKFTTRSSELAPFISEIAHLVVWLAQDVALEWEWVSPRTK